MLKKVNQILELVCGILVGLLFLVVLFQIIARIVLGIPATWTVEMGHFLFLGIVFLGVPCLINSKGQMVISSAHDKLKGLPLFVVDMINYFVIFCVLIFLGFGAYERTVTNWDIMNPAISWMRVGYFYLIMLAGVVGMVAFTIQDVLKYIKDRRKKCTSH